MNKFLNEREQKIFNVCAATLFCALLFNGVYIPLQAKKIDLDQNIVIQKKLIEQNLRIIQKADEAHERYEQYEQKYLITGTGQEATSTMLTEIETVAGKLGIQVTDLKPGKVHNNEIDSTYSVSLTVNSQLVDIVQFLYILQQAPYSLDVEKIELEQTARRGQEKLIARLILGKTFVLPEDQDVKVSIEARKMAL